MRSQFKHNCLSNLETNVKEIFNLVNITKKKKKKKKNQIKSAGQLEDLAK